MRKTEGATCLFTYHERLSIIWRKKNYVFIALAKNEKFASEIVIDRPAGFLYVYKYNE